MRVLICGMPRSGSSLLWGIVLTILNLKDPKYKLGLVCDYKNESLPNNNIILKIHECNYNSKLKSMNSLELRKWADIIIVTKRDIRCSLSSLIRKKKKKGKNNFKFFNDKLSIIQYKNLTNIYHLDFICNFITKKCYEDWIELSDFIFIYEDYMINKNLIVNQLKKILKCEDINNNIIFSELSKINNKWINNKNHITSNIINYKDYSNLDNDILEIIDNKYYKYKL